MQPNHVVALPVDDKAASTMAAQLMNQGSQTFHEQAERTRRQCALALA